MIWKTPVKAIMSQNVVVAHQFHNLSQVIQLFTQYPVHHLPVVDAHNHVVGIISSNDLPKLFLNPEFRKRKLSLNLDELDTQVNITELMTQNPVTIDSEDPIAKAARIFSTKRFQSLPVVEGGKLVGIITLKDIIEFLVDVNEEQERNED